MKKCLKLMIMREGFSRLHRKFSNMHEKVPQANDNGKVPRSVHSKFQICMKKSLKLMTLREGFSRKYHIGYCLVPTN